MINKRTLIKGVGATLALAALPIPETRAHSFSFEPKKWYWLPDTTNNIRFVLPDNTFTIYHPNMSLWAFEEDDDFVSSKGVGFIRFKTISDEYSKYLRMFPPQFYQKISSFGYHHQSNQPPHITFGGAVKAQSRNPEFYNNWRKAIKANEPLIEFLIRQDDWVSKNHREYGRDWSMRNESILK